MSLAAPAATPAGRKSKVGERRRIGERRIVPYLFIVPHYLMFIGFVLLPFLFSIVLSTQRYNFTQQTSRTNFPNNYVNLFTPDSLYFEQFWKTLWNTVIFVFLSTPALIVAALFLAVLLNGKFRGRNGFRAIYFAPWTLGVAVVGLLWYWILNSQSGLLTIWLNAFGLTSPGWLTETPWAWISILLATVWWTVGFNVIILLAGLQAISADLYEAAAIDGASKWQQFRHITVPSLRPILLLVVTLQIIASFNLVGQPQFMTGGGPGDDTRPVLMYIYETGFLGRQELGQAAAMALLVAAIMIVVSVVNFKFFSSERS